MPNEKPFLIQTSEQLRVLNSPTASGIFESLRARSPQSIRDLSAALGVGEKAIHAHVARLKRIGLVVEAGERRTGRRPRKLFAPACRNVRLAPRRSGRRFREEKVRGVRLLLRQAERELSRAIEARADEPPTATRVRLTRDVVRLGDADLKRLKRMLDEAVAAANAAHDAEKAHHVTVTIAVAPASASR